MNELGRDEVPALEPDKVEAASCDAMEVFDASLERGEGRSGQGVVDGKFNDEVGSPEGVGSRGELEVLSIVMWFVSLSRKWPSRSSDHVVEMRSRRRSRNLPAAAHFRILSSDFSYSLSRSAQRLESGMSCYNRTCGNKDKRMRDAKKEEMSIYRMDPSTLTKSASSSSSSLNWYSLNSALLHCK